MLGIGPPVPSVVVELPRVLSDRYVLISHLARGGMADVYVAEDRRLGRRVAVKILHDQYANNDAFVERFRREAQAAAGLTHKGVVSVYDWGEDEGVYFMVMELVQGRNLRDVLKAEGALLPRRVAEIGLEVASALSAAHELGIVHRDVKPANILLAPDGSVKVADFGIARAFDDSDQLTRTGAVIGTATYFSPEQAQGQSADSRSDIYSLGVVLYELLTAQPPFAGESPVAVAYQHVEKTPPKPTDLDPAIPRGLEAVVLKAMAKKPAERYQTADDLRRDLRRLLEGQVPAIVTDDAPTRLMAATPGIPPATPPTAPEPVDAEPAYREPGRLEPSTIAIGALAAAALLGLGIMLLVRLLGPNDGGIEIPDVRGQTEAVATANLEDRGFIVTSETVADDELPPGIATGTDPAAGGRLERGDEITLLVSGGPANIPVPDVRNRTLSDAEALIRSAGLAVGAITYEVSDDVPADTVISQDPDPGDLVTASTPVDLVVSGGADALIVPNVANRSEEDALFALQEAGFGAGQVLVERRPHGTVVEGFVIETDPAPGETVPITGTVTVFVSEGAVPTVVPNSVGLMPEEATTLLEEWGFVAVVGSEINIAWNDPNDGRVAEQSPQAGQIQEFGAEVTIRIGRAATENTVPSVTGKTEADARADIEGAGFLFAKAADTPLAPGDPNIGRVASQNPAGGGTRTIGSTVTVSIGIEGAVVPNLFTGGTGSCTIAVTQAVAQQRITNAQLTMNASTLPPSEDEYYLRWDTTAVPPAYDLSSRPDCEGRTVSQSPAPGAVVTKNSTVQVSFDPVRAPAAVDIYGRTITEVNDAYQQGIVWLVGTTNGGECHDAGNPSGQIRLIDPAPTQVVPFNQAQSRYEAFYWVSVNNPARPACPPLP